MKPIIQTLIVIGILMSPSSRAEITAKSDNLQLKVGFVGKVYPLPSPDGHINCSLTDLTTNQTIAIVYEPESSYFYRAELFDGNGAAVPKTELGQTKGVHFGDLDPEVGEKKSKIKFDDNKFGSGGNEVHLLYNGNEIIAYKRSFADGVARCPIQPAPLKLFNIPSSGEYRLRLTFQFFELIDNKAIKLVRFPTIEEKFTVKSEDLKTKTTTAIHESAPSLASASAPAHAKTVPPLHVQSSKVLNKGHPALAFAGYDSPDSALESWIWAYCQGDMTNMLQSLTPAARKDFKRSLDVMTDAGMKDHVAKIRAEFSGYTAQKMDIVSDTEVILNYTLVGSDRVQKMVIQKIGKEWKVAGPSPDSPVSSVSVPAQKIQSQNH